MRDKERFIGASATRRMPRREMDPTKTVYAGAAAIAVLVGVLAAADKIDVGGKTPGEILRQNGQELYRDNLSQGELVDARVDEVDGDPVAFRELPRIDSEGENIITRIPHGSILKGVLVEDELTGQVWLETEWDRKFGFIKASELDVLTDIHEYDVEPLSSHD